MADTMAPEQVKAVLERHRVLREELRPRERVFAGGKEYRETVCELWDALASALEQLERAAKWIGQSIHEEGCRSFYDDATGVCINESPAINDERCDCGLQEQFVQLPGELQASVLAALPPAPEVNDDPLRPR